MTTLTPVIAQSKPGAVFAARRAEMIDAISRVVDSGWYILGSEVQNFEGEFSSYVGASHGIGVASGTDAVQLALRAAGVKPGDGVLTVAHTAVATIVAIEQFGAIPVLVDIDPDRQTMCPNRLNEVIEEVRGSEAGLYKALKAILPVHLYGQAADILDILAVADNHGLVVVEDCAQAHGTEISGRRAGSFGLTAAFSFYPTKNLPAMGDGGFVVTQSPDADSLVRLLRQYGWRERYQSDVVGMTSRLDELQAAVLRVGLRYLDDDNSRRREIAARYDSGLASATVRTPSLYPSVTHTYHQYVIRTSHRDAFRDHLRTRGVVTLVHYPVPVHLQPAYRGRLFGAGALGQTESAAEEVVSLPMHPFLENDDVDRVIEAVCSWTKG